MTEVRLPKPGDAITEAEVTEFFHEEGGSVTEGEPLYSIATDKAEMDIDSPATGTVSWRVDEGNTYEVGELIAVIS